MAELSMNDLIRGGVAQRRARASAPTEQQAAQTRQEVSARLSAAADGGARPTSIPARQPGGGMDHLIRGAAATAREQSKTGIVILGNPAELPVRKDT